MTDDAPVPARRALSGQIVQPLRDDLQLPPAPFGVPLFATVKYRSQERQLKAYRSLVEAKSALLRALDEQRGLLVQREISITRLEHLDELREIERLKITNELASLKQEAEIHNLRKRVEIEELHARLADAKRRRRMMEDPKASPEEMSAPEKLTEALRQVQEIDEVLRGQRAKIIEAAGGEENLSAEERNRLDQIEVLRRTHVEKLYEDLS